MYPAEMVYWGNLPTVTVFQCKFPFFLNLSPRFLIVTVDRFSVTLGQGWRVAPTQALLDGLHWGGNLRSIPSIYVSSLPPFLIIARVQLTMFVIRRFPTLNGISVFCLSSQHASEATRKVFTNIFGGAGGNEGLGLGSLSFDWQYIGRYGTVYLMLA